VKSIEAFPPLHSRKVLEGKSERRSLSAKGTAKPRIDAALLRVLKCSLVLKI
jgi:hypothetical protein